MASTQDPPINNRADNVNSAGEIGLSDNVDTPDSPPRRRLRSHKDGYENQSRKSIKLEDDEVNSFTTRAASRIVDDDYDDDDDGDQDEGGDHESEEHCYDETQEGWPRCAAYDARFQNVKDEVEQLAEELKIALQDPECTTDQVERLRQRADDATFVRRPTAKVIGLLGDAGAGMFPLVPLDTEC
jgi:hypothetical protein